MGRWISVRSFVGAVTVMALVTFGAAQGDEATALRIEMGEYYFQLEGQERNEAIVLEAGVPYVLSFVNVGAMEHEVLIGRGLLVEDDVPDGYETNLLEGVEMDVTGGGWYVEVGGVIEFELEAGESITLEVTIPEARVGTWEIGCFIPGHYQAGMKAPFEVR